MARHISIGIIEDEQLQRDLLKDILKSEGFQVSTFSSGKGFIESTGNDFFDILLVDFRLPDMNGLEILQKAKKIFPFIQVIIITAFGNVELAVETMKHGAFDFLTKPIKKDELIVRLNKAIEFLTVSKELKRLKEEMGEKGDLKNFIYKSREMENVVKLSLRIANSNANILITGETGTGKEKIAEIIHYSSSRAKMPLVKVNIAAIPDTLLESELFGAEKGAYTGAYKRMLGKFEAADKGSIFLDEISEIPLMIQAKLLRVIQEKKVNRLGAPAPIDTDVRIIAATNKNLEELVNDKLFRDDLFFRLNVIKIDLPPLRDRRDDIPYLVDYFLKKFNKKEGKAVSGLSSEVIEMLSRYNFPGNIRELENIIERGIILNSSGSIESDEVIPFLNLSKSKSDLDIDMKKPMPEIIENIERKMITEALKKTGGIKTKAAQLLGISERVLRYKISQLNNSDFVQS